MLLGVEPGSCAFYHQRRTRTEDGRLTMDSAQCVYGYMDNHIAEPTNDFFTPTGEILYE